MQEARAIIASLRAQLSAASLAEQQQQAQEEEEVAALSEAKCDREVFEGIKARVVKEFGLGPEYVGKRLALNALFPQLNHRSEALKTKTGCWDGRCAELGGGTVPGRPRHRGLGQLHQVQQGAPGEATRTAPVQSLLMSFLGPLSATALGGGLRLTSLELS